MKFDRITFDHLSPIDDVLLTELIKHVHEYPADSSIKGLSKYFDVSDARMEFLINEGIKLDLMEFRVIKCRGMAVQEVIVNEDGELFIEECRDWRINAKIDRNS